MRKDLWVGELLDVQERGSSKKRPYSAILSHHQRIYIFLS